jgi:hypothetical protein
VVERRCAGAHGMEHVGPRAKRLAAVQHDSPPQRVWRVGAQRRAHVGERERSVRVRFEHSEAGQCPAEPEERVLVGVAGSCEFCDRHRFAVKVVGDSEGRRRENGLTDPWAAHQVEAQHSVGWAGFRAHEKTSAVVRERVTPLVRCAGSDRRAKWVCRGGDRGHRLTEYASDVVEMH